MTLPWRVIPEEASIISDEAPQGTDPRGLCQESSSELWFCEEDRQGVLHVGLSPDVGPTVVGPPGQA